MSAVARRWPKLPASVPEFRGTAFETPSACADYTEELLRTVGGVPIRCTLEMGRALPFTAEAPANSTLFFQLRHGGYPVRKLGFCSVAIFYGFEVLDVGAMVCAVRERSLVERRCGGGSLRFQ